MVNKRILVLFLFLIYTVALVAAYNPPAGGESVHKLLSTDLAARQISAAGDPFDDGVPAGAAVNPALIAGEQRPIIDASYLALIGFKEDKNWGHVINLSGLYPARWGAIAGGIHFLTSPFPGIPLGTAGSFRFSYAKDITDKLYLGTGAYATVGAGSTWGLGLDIGGLYKFGTLGILKDARLGISLTGMGKPYNPNTEGVKGEGSDGYAGMFTPHIGFSALLVSVKHFKLGTSFDLSLPTFQNLVFSTSLQMKFDDAVALKTGWTFNLVETIQKKQTYIPSVGIAFHVNLEPKRKQKPESWKNSELRPELAFKPYSKNIWAMGAGVNVHVGMKDNEPPVIVLDYPTEQAFSPNDDGIQDSLEVPMTIRDRRYVTAWQCKIEDSRGITVRVIENKQPIRELQNFKSFWRNLTAAKKGVYVPEFLRWDGRTDTGEVAPDGKYYFSVTASDDNNNTATSPRYAVTLDTEKPSIVIQPPKEKEDMIFSPDGDGNKDTFLIQQAGSLEEKWHITIKNTANNTVFTKTLENKVPSNFEWNGKDTEGKLVPDGVYTYTIAATDRAGNSNSATLSNIIVNTERQRVNIGIDTKAFSPNGDGVKDTVKLYPDLSNTANLHSLNIEIKNKLGKTVRNFARTTKESFYFDGKDDSGKILPDGNYRAIITAKYKNGYVAQAQSPTFVLDTVPPTASVQATSSIFSPDGDGNLDTVTFAQNFSKEDSWIGEIYATNKAGKLTGEPVKTIIIRNSLNEYVWNGRTDSGTAAPDGLYAYRLSGIDIAGNKGYSNTAIVELNTEKAEVILSSDITAFSPNGDGIKDTVRLIPTIKSKTKIVSFSLTIKDSSGKNVRVFDGNGNPKQEYVWDGKNSSAEKCTDGLYSAKLSVQMENGQEATSKIDAITIDTEYPQLEISVPYLSFSAKEESNRPTLPIKQHSSHEDLWTGIISDAKNNPVKKLTWAGKTENFTWDGSDDAGNRVPNGTYSYTVFATDAAGNATSRTLKGITVNSTEPKLYITYALPAFSPNGDGIKDVQTFSLHHNMGKNVSDWSVSIVAASGEIIRTWNKKETGELPSTLVWNGLDNNKKPLAGKFFAKAKITTVANDNAEANTSTFVSVLTPPQIDVSLSPKYFSPDNDGIDDELYIGLRVSAPAGIAKWVFEIHEPEDAGYKLFWKTSGSEKISDKIIWDGRSSVTGETVQSATDYPFTFTVTDTTGLVGIYKGFIPVDVLIIRDGNRLKIAVPSIIFRKNEPDFQDLPQVTVNKNLQVLKRIAQILNKFPDYKIRVEGHANTTTGTLREEREYLLPLSEKRAEAIRQYLIENGVRASRLTAEGKGGTEPVADFTDRNNWWKNRRVEFILIK